MQSSELVRLQVNVAHPQGPCETPPFYGWDFRDGTKWADFYRRSSDILVRFHGLADFVLSADGARVSCVPVPGVSNATVEHLFLNQVLPLALSRLGKLVFHAGAVAVEGGAVCFSGETGRGKSTLTASFAIDGAPFLTDDAFVLHSAEGGYDVEPTHPSLRLWGDSEQQILGKLARAAPPVSYTPKARLLACDALPHCDEPKRLLVAYFLGDVSAQAISIRPLPGAERLIEWAKNSFLLDIEDKSQIGEHFYRVAEVANRVPAFALDYPRQYDRLPAVLDSVRAHVKSLSRQ
jgi:hypothetical protein